MTTEVSAAHGNAEAEVFPTNEMSARGLSVNESERTRLIGEISRAIQGPTTPAPARAAGLTLIGWLARRMPGECAHALGVEEARESGRRIRASRNKL